MGGGGGGGGGGKGGGKGEKATINYYQVPVHVQWCHSPRQYTDQVCLPADDKANIW